MRECANYLVHTITYIVLTFLEPFFSGRKVKVVSKFSDLHYREILEAGCRTSTLPLHKYELTNTL